MKRRWRGRADAFRATEWHAHQRQSIAGSNWQTKNMNCGRKALTAPRLPVS
jgi:hypothetical protein